MIVATVVGPVWASKRVNDFPAGALLEIQRHNSNERYIALDNLGSGPGDDVLVALGAAVSDYLPGKSPVDAMVIGLLDQPTNNTRDRHTGGASTPMKGTEQ